MLGTRFLYCLQEIRLDGEAPARDYMTAPHVINLATASPVASRGRPAIRHDTEIPLSRQFPPPVAICVRVCQGLKILSLFYLSYLNRKIKSASDELF